MQLDFFVKISNSKRQHAFLLFFTPKTACYQPRISMQTGIFFQISSSEKQHAFLLFFTPKTACYQPRISMQTGIFFPNLQLRKTTCISTIFTPKTACYQPRNIYMQPGFFFLFFKPKKQHAQKSNTLHKNRRFKPYKTAVLEPNVTRKYTTIWSKLSCTSPNIKAELRGH